MKMKPNPFTSNNKALVGIVQDRDVNQAVATCLNLIGGLGRLEIRGKTVLLKPNVNSDDPFPGTTNPAVVAAVVSQCYQAGATTVIVGDCSNPSYHPSVKTMEKLGIKQAAEAAGASVVGFEDGEWVSVQPQGAHYLRSFSIPALLFQVDVLVEIPVVKTHSLATYTMSLKNLVGIIHPKDRLALHRSGHLEEAIPEIHLAVHPQLIVMDGTRTMIAGGPFRGPTVDTNLILASGDRIAIDLVGLSIIKHFGRWQRVAGAGVWEQQQIQRAIALGLGAKAASEIEVVSAAAEGAGDELAALVQDIQRYLWTSG